MRVHPGAANGMVFAAGNPTDQSMVAQAMQYLPEPRSRLSQNRVFCFDQQVLAARDGAEMPLQFIVDQALPDIHTITFRIHCSMSPTR